MTKVWAHRGASGYAPENTIESFMLAVEQGADGVELDVQLSKDGQMVVFHDETLERVSDGKGYLKDHTLEQLKKLDVNQQYSKYGVVRIPTLQEVLEVLKETKLTINIEIKNGVFFYPGIEEKVCGLVKEMGMEDRIWYSSFNHYAMKKIREINPQAKTGLLFGDITLDMVEYTKKQDIMAIHPGVFHLQLPNLLAEAKRMRLETHIWTVNEESLIKHLCEAQVEAIITNYPDRCLEICQNTLL